MRLRSVFSSGAACWMLLTGTTGSHQPFQFVYSPAPGHRVTLIFETEGNIRLNGIPNIRDASAGEFQSMTSVTERVREDLGDGAVISVIHDSSYAQYRVEGGWVEIPAEWSALGPFQWIRDRRFISSPVSFPPDPFFVNVARGLQWTPEIPLPERPLEFGDTWAVEFPFPVTTQIPSDSALVIAVDLLAQGTARFDSIVPRATDTLAFVTLSATLAPSTVEDAFSDPRGDLPVNLSGSINGSYIWSTGWHTWVANQSRVALQHRIVGLDATMMLAVEAHSRIRP